MIYVVGGADLFTSQIAADGTIGPWTTEPPVSGLQYNNAGGNAVTLVGSVLVIVNSSNTVICQLSGSGHFDHVACVVSNPATFSQRSAYTSNGKVYVTATTGKVYRMDGSLIPQPPVVASSAANAITNAGATLNGSVNPNQSATDARFEWGTDTNYGNLTAAQAIGSGIVSVATNAQITGLLPHTLYHFRATATNNGGTNNGDDVTFTTANTTPVAINDTVELPMTHFSVMGNDTDGDLDSLTVSAVDSAAHGTATLESDNTVTYTPNGTFTGTDTFNYTISDGFGGSSIGTVTVRDTTAPVVAVHVNVTAEATSAGGATVGYAAGSAADNVGVTSLTYSQNSGTNFPIAVTTVTITANDASNNTGTGTFTVTVQDTTAPIVAAHANVVAEATSAGGATVSYATGSASDTVGVTSLTYSQNSGTVFPVGVTTVTITARDAANNQGTGTFTVTVQDTTAPVITVTPGLQIVNTGNSATAALPDVTTLVSATDNVGVVSKTQSPAVGTQEAPGTYDVVVTAVDAAGLTAQTTVQVRVADNAAPVVTAHANVIVEATSAGGATVDYAAGSASDNVGVTSLTYSQNNGTVFPIGVTTVTITAKDAANNQGTGTFTVTVQDMTAPVVAAHANVIVEATSAGGATVNYAAGSAADAVGVTSLTYSQNSGTNFLIGTTTVTITAKDADNNTGTGTFTVTVRDATAPAIAAHSNVTVEATSAAGALVNYSAASASDVVGVTSLTYSQNSGTVFPVGVTTVTITARDAASNAGNGTFTVTVVDTTAPVVAAHANVTVEATSAAGAVVAYAAGSAIDAVGVTSLTYSQNSGTAFSIGTTTVTITASDAANNQGTGTFTVTVRDTTAPVVLAHGNVSVMATSSVGATVSYAAGSASDAGTANPTITYSQNSGTLFPIGTTTVTITAMDAFNNTGTGTFTVTVANNVPVVMLLGANPLMIEAAASYSDPGATATDVEDGSRTPSITSNTVVANVPGTYAVTWATSDSANAAGSATRVVTVVDTTAPVVAAHANVTVEATSPAGAVVNYSAASATDIVGATSITYSKNTGTTFALGTTTVTITANDAANNTGTGTFTVMVQDTIAPVITFSPGIQTINTSGVGTTVALPNVAALVTATDSVGIVSKTQSPAAGTLVVAGRYDIVVTVSDAAGHSTQSTVSVTVSDPVEFTSHPASTFVHEGSSVSFTVAITGTEPLSYQWEHNNQPITSETAATLTIPDAKATDGGSYRCVVTNVGGSKTSDAATLEVRLRPRITVNPESQEVRPKGAVTFKVEVAGYAPMTYRWRKDGVDLPGETGVELSLSNVAAAATGRYTVVVTNEVMSVESEDAELRLIAWVEVDGTYQGLVLHDNSVSPAEPHYLGRLTVTLSKLGAMTGKVEYRGLTHSFSGKLTPELNYQRTILRKNQGPLNLSMHLDASAFTLSAHLSEFIQAGQFHSGATMLLHGFNASKNPAPQAGRYTMRIKQGTDSTGGPDAPGYALASISKSGVVKMTGKMSDGSALSCSTLLNEDGTAAFYDPLYKAAYPYAGYIAGPITFDPAAGLQAVTGNLEWKKPAQTKDVFWPLGFSQTRELEGSLYIPPIRGQRILNLPDLSGAMTFTASGPASFTNNFLLTTANHLVLLDFPNTRKLGIKLVPATGITTGSFYDSTLRKTRQLQGVALQAQGEISGFFLSDTDPSEWTFSPP